MVLGMMPGIHASAAQKVNLAPSLVADASTIGRAPAIYGDNTLNTGRITVDKSVSAGLVSFADSGVTITPAAEHFLVTLSQAAQATSLASQIEVPLDVVFVLDTSGSMATEVSDTEQTRLAVMLETVNSAISTLMSLNDQNRVGVVAFSAYNTQAGTAGPDAANVLSPLAHYEGDAATEHLTIDKNGGTVNWGSPFSVDLIVGRDPDGTPGGSRYNHGGSTNIQAGVALGAQQLMNATTTAEVNGVTVNRMPFLIILSDGGPVSSSGNNDWTNPSMTVHMGNNSTHYAGNAFLPMLTAAYYKDRISDHYADDLTIYTMGFAVGETTTDPDLRDSEQDLADITMNPAEELSNTTENRFVNTIRSYWNSYNSNQNFSIQVGTPAELGNYTSDGQFDFYASNTQVPVSQVNDVADNTTMYTAEAYYGVRNNGSVTFTDNIHPVSSLAYNDDYFSATTAADLNAAFSSILALIQAKAHSSPTKVTSGDHNFDGYVTFTDPLGEYMEVKDMKGIIADGNYYQGTSAAKYLDQLKTKGASDDPEFDAVIKEVLTERLALSKSPSTDADELLKALLNSHLESDENSLVWWGHEYTMDGEEDTSMQILGVADYDSVDYITASTTSIPKGATHVCRSYFYYGTAGGTVENPDHNYMYFVIRVQRSLTAPYQQTVVVSIPSSLLSVERVTITETTDNTYTAQVVEDTPVRVVYEVGLMEGINAGNVASVVSENYANEAVVGEGQKNKVGDTYYFFTNDWNRSVAGGQGQRPMTKATFDAALDNPHYAYQEDTPVYADQKGTPLTASNFTAGMTAYVQRTYYDWAGKTAANGVYAAEKKVAYIPVTLSAAPSKLIGTQYAIPQGAYTASFGSDADENKTQNLTNTAQGVSRHNRTGAADNSHYTVHLGNNGVLSLTIQPPTKTVALATAPSVNIDGKAVMVGQKLEYTINAINYEATAADITVTDTIPVGTKLVADSITNGGTLGTDGKTITWTLTNVEPSTMVPVSFQVEVDISALESNVDAITNQATVIVGENTYKTNITTNPPEGKKVSIGNAPVTGPVQVGQELMYSIEWHNDSGAVADVTVTDVIPAGTAILPEGNEVTPISHNGKYDAASRTVTWIFEDVAANASGVVTFYVEVTADAVSPLVNGAEIKIGENAPRVTNKTSTDLEFGDLVLTKAIAAGDNATGKTFTLTLTESSGLLSGAYKLNDNGTVTFTKGVATVSITGGQSLRIHDLPAGVTIAVTETNVPAGWTPSYSVTQVTIIANDTAPATVTVTNDYRVQSASFQLQGTKSFTGANFPNGGTFTFRAQQSDANGVVMANGRTALATVQKVAGSDQYTFAFDRVTYTEAFAAPRYYLITEDSVSIPGVTTDPARYLLTLNVTDDGAGKLVVTHSLKKLNGTTWADATALAFENSYTPQETSITLSGTKNLTGRELVADEFDFLLIDGATGTTLQTASNSVHAAAPNKGSFTFAPIVYTAKDLAGATEKTFTYYIRESVGSGMPHVTFDETIYEVKVTVRDVNGQLVASKTITPWTSSGTSYTQGAAVEAIAFNNTYTVQDTFVTLEATKNTTGEPTPENTTFSYTVYKTDSAGSTRGAVVAVGSSGANGKVAFNPIGFTHADMEGAEKKNFYFLVVEDKLNLAYPNMYFDETEYLVTVPVHYNKTTGAMSVGTVTYSGGSSMTFNNIQNPSEVTYTPVAHKTTSGSSIPADIRFSFSVVAAAAYDNVAAGTLVATGEGPANEKVAFDPLTFKNTGTYYYWIYETNAPADGNAVHGITYDYTRYLLKVVVNRDAKSKLQIASWAYYEDAARTMTVEACEATTAVATSADTTSRTDEIRFQNGYAAKGSITLTATKVLTGRGLKQGEFSFVLRDEDGNIVGTGSIPAASMTNGVATAPITFSTLFYDDGDVAANPSVVLKYTMEEVKGTISGVTYDETVHTVYIRLTHDGAGNIKAEIVESDDVNAATKTATGIVFRNDYTVTNSVDVILEALKTLEGRELKANEFGFALARLDNGTWKDVGTAFNAADGKITFKRTFSADSLNHMAFENGQYTVIYRISEVKSGLGGVTYSGSKYYAKVVITHNEAAASYAAELVGYFTDEACTQAAEQVVFKNTYDTNDTQLVLEADKIYLGANNKPMADASGFSFLVTEVNANGEPLKVTIGGKESNKIVATGTSDKDGNVTFSPLYYTEVASGANAVSCGGSCGTANCSGKVHDHYYMISEAQGTDRRITYSTEKYWLQVTIHDNGTGKLSVLNTQYFKGESWSGKAAVKQEDVSFTNHHGSGELYLTLDLNKSFQTGAGNPYNYQLSGSEFNFQVYTVGTDGKETEVTVGTNGPTDANGIAKISFGTIYISRDDLGGAKTKDFVYYIRELDHLGGSFITKDTAVIKATVTVTDDGYGNLSAVCVYTDLNDAPKDGFVNTYIAEGTSVNLDITKLLSGKDLTNEKFTFELKSGDTLIQSVQNDANGKATIKLDYTTPDMSGATRNADGTYTKVFTYTLTEKAAVENGVANGKYTYDDAKYTITVTLTDDGSGKLSASVAVAKGAEDSSAIIFQNHYYPNPVTKDLTAPIGAVKIVVDEQGNVLTREDVTFHFTVTNLDGDVVATGTAKGTQEQNTITFTPFTFNAAGEYRYQITEQAMDNQGYIIDTNVWCTHIPVKYDAKEGKLYIDDADVYTHPFLTTLGLEEELATDNEQPPVFTNVYDTNGVSLVLQLTKVLEGRALKANEFSFTMADANGIIAARGRNDADGKVFFYLNYSLADLGGAMEKTFTYTITEDRGSDPNITYSAEKHTVTVKLTDNGSGKLTATVGSTSISGSVDTPVSTGIEITNIHTPDPIPVTLTAQKQLEGRDLIAGEFKFQVTDQDGKLITTGTNTADDTITFAPFEVEQAMEVVLYVSEVKGDNAGMIYDDTVYRIKLTVTNENGVLKAVTTALDGDVVFHNQYKGTPPPATGDDTPVFQYAVLAMFSLMTVAALVLLDRKIRF